MFCQFRAPGSLHSNCQGHKAGGGKSCRMTDVTEGWIKKQLSVFGMCWGFQALRGEGMGEGRHVILLVLSALALRCKSALAFLPCSTPEHSAQDGFVKDAGYVGCLYVGESKERREKKKPFCSVESVALWCSRTLLFVHVWMHNLVQTKNGNLRATSW